MNVRGKSGAGDLNGFLDSGSHLKGELEFEQTFRVDGKITGNVVSSGDLIVGEHGEVEGEIRVGRLFVSGRVRGQIHASRRLEIAVGGRVEGVLETPALVVEEGARFDGECRMPKPETKGADETGRVVGRIPAGKP